MQILLKKCALLLSAYLNVIISVSAESNLNPKSLPVTQMYFALDTENYDNCWVKLSNDCVVIGMNMSGSSIGRGDNTNHTVPNARHVGIFYFESPVRAGTELYVWLDQPCINQDSPRFEGEGKAIQDGVIWVTCSPEIKNKKFPSKH
jgi:hypothetical protein